MWSLRALCCNYFKTVNEMLKKKIKFSISNLIARKSERFRGLHSGEACYIFGDGPSIKWFDLGSFSDLPSICCNFMPFHKDFDKLDVRYCSIIEPYAFVPKIFHPQNRDVTGAGEILKEYRSIIKNNPDIQYFVSASNFLSLRGKNVNFMFRELPKSRNKTDDMLRQFDCFNGTFHAVLSLAYYMGFKKIYLVGFDAWTLQPARELHWYELGEGRFFEATNFATEFLNVLQNEVEIITIAYDGQSKNIQCISYEYFTGKRPKFRENHELLSEHHLDVFATYPDFKIRQAAQ